MPNVLSRNIYFKIPIFLLKKGTMHTKVRPNQNCYYHSRNAVLSSSLHTKRAGRSLRLSCTFHLELFFFYVEKNERREKKKEEPSNTQGGSTVGWREGRAVAGVLPQKRRAYGDCACFSLRVSPVVTADVRGSHWACAGPPLSPAAEPRRRADCTPVRAEKPPRAFSTLPHLPLVLAPRACMGEIRQSPQWAARLPLRRTHFPLPHPAASGISRVCVFVCGLCATYNHLCIFFNAFFFPPCEDDNV